MSKLFVVEKIFHFLFIGVAIVACIAALVFVAGLGFWQAKGLGDAAAPPPPENNYAPDSYEMPWEAESFPTLSPEEESLPVEEEVLPGEALPAGEEAVTDGQ